MSMGIFPSAPRFLSVSTLRSHAGRIGRVPGYRDDSLLDVPWIELIDPREQPADNQKHAEQPPMPTGARSAANLTTHPG